MHNVYLFFGRIYWSSYMYTYILLQYYIGAFIIMLLNYIVRVWHYVLKDIISRLLPNTPDDTGDGLDFFCNYVFIFTFNIRGYYFLSLLQ